MKYRTIYIDPPWNLEMVTGFSHSKHKRPKQLPYPTMSIEEIKALPLPDLVDTNCHLWLWTTNKFLPDGFDLMRYWGFKYMLPIHWIKPSGFGAWWVHRTQSLLFGYKGKLDMKERFKPNIIHANPTRHSAKPTAAYELIEQVSHGPRLEMFARSKRSSEWDIWGNEMQNDIELPIANDTANKVDCGQGKTL